MSKYNWGKMVIVAVIIFFVMPSLSPAQITSERKGGSGSDEIYNVQYTVCFSEDDLIFSTLMGYDTIEIKDGSCINEIGKPRLPSKQIKIALPAGIAVKSVKAVSIEKMVIRGRYNIFPAQPPLKTDLSSMNVDFVEPEIDLYSSEKPYPGKSVRFSHQTDLAGQGIAVIQLYPLQYVPHDKKLTLSTSIIIEIKGKGGYECGDYLPQHISENYRKKYEQMTRDMVINPKEVKLNTDPRGTPASLGLPSGGPYDHVIITSSSYQSYFDDLVEWHTKRGLKDTVVNTTYIYSNYGGSDDQEKIRNFIIDAHGTWGTQYFLMGGEHETVPFEYRNYIGENTPSDQYYSDYDDDWTHEVFVGRVSIQSSTEANTFIDKVINYEKNPPLTDYILDVLLIGMDADDYTEMQYLKEDIDGYIPSRFDVTKVYDSDPVNPPTQTHKTDAIDALNEGQHLVNHADHGYMYYMGTGSWNHDLGIGNGNVDALTNNGKPSIVVTLACLVNQMTYNDCIAEHFVIYNPNQAGVAFIGNTGNGLYYQDNDEYPYYLSNKLDYWWWRTLFDENKYILGETLASAKHHFGTDPWNPDAGRHCVWEFSLLGEPAMPIWTDTPANFDVNHPLDLPIGSSPFTVHVEDAGGDIYNAYVCLWKGDEVYLTGSTNVDGDITFNPSPSTTGTMYVTVTKHNYLPYESSAEVSEGEQFELHQELGHNHSQCCVIGDIDNDGYLDLAVSILGCGGDPTQIYFNDRTGILTLDYNLYEGPSFYTYTNLFADLDRNAYLDLITVGGWQASNPGQTWFNDGFGWFAEGQELDSTRTKGAVTGDIDNDGDVDLVTSYKIYRNDGTGNLIGESYEELGASVRAVAIGDVNNDGYLDIITGKWGGNKVCLNDGTGHFAATAQNIGGGDTHDLALGDIDGDEYLDLIVADELYAANQPNKIYLNDGTGTFIDTGQRLGNAPSWSLAIGDIDNDGDLDFVVGNNYDYPDEVYLNDGSGIFTFDMGLGTEWTMDVALGDIDNDGDLDLIASSYFNASDKVYLNSEATTINTAPNPPGSINAVPSGSTVTLSWDDGSDDITPQEILTYNIRVGTNPNPMDNNNNILSGIIPAGPGNVGHHLTYTLKDLSPDTYYWSVQTVDGSYIKSEWTTRPSFTIS